MRTLVRIAVVALLALPFSACTDKTDLLRPKSSADLLIPWYPVERLPTIKLPSPEDFAQITAGYYHTCARKYNNKVYCWGRDAEGQVGQWTTKVCASSGALCIDKPTYIMDAKVVDAGGNHACALNSANAAFCWGSSSHGQLGANVYGSVSSPVPVSGGLTFSSISAGASSTCGTTSGGMFCWGAIVSGGGAAASGVPSPTLISSYNGYSSVSVGYLHACGYYNFGGSYRGVECWGNNRFGQTGIDPATFPIAPFTINSQLGVTNGPASIESDFTCADVEAGTVQCMGYNYWGQLGNGQTGNSTHIPQTVGGGQQLHGVAVGVNHACALDANNAIYCWGNGYHGQLGNNASGIYTSPQLVTGGRTYRAVAAGYLHTCAIGTDNHIYCWGNNHNGQLGTQYPGGWVSNPVQAIDP